MKTSQSRGSKSRCCGWPWRLKDLVLWRAYAPEPKGGWPKQLAQKARAASRNEEEEKKLEAP